MKNLHFDDSFEVRYSEDVRKYHYTIKGIPQDSARQKIKNYQMEMIPEAKPEWGHDSFGNAYIWGCNEVPHRLFRFRIYGDAVCGIADYEETVKAKDLMIYRHATKYTTAGKNIREYFQTAAKETSLEKCESEYEKAVCLMNRLYSDFGYEKGVTDVHTPAEEAFSIRKGVCQDYSHILISLLQLAGCSARYVTGFLLGEGASHAWVEVADHGKWYGVDPTNHLVVSDSHIRIGVGRMPRNVRLTEESLQAAESRRSRHSRV